MITQTDIQKLKQVFITKEDAKKFATKDDLLEVKKDIVGVKDDIRDVIGGIHTIIEMIGEEKTKNKEHDNILEQHERRLDNLEDKVLSTN